MTIDKILEIFNPQLEAGLARTNSFKNLQQRDVTRFFGPVIESVCRASGIPPELGAVAADGFPLPEPGEKLTMADVQAIVEMLVVLRDQDNPAPRVEAAQDRQIALEAEVTGTDDRKAPLARRSQEGIQKELFELRTGYVRGPQDAEGRWTYGKKIPDVVMDKMSANNREEKLQAELDRREVENFELANA
jgi:hypothetical protein